MNEHHSKEQIENFLPCKGTCIPPRCTCHQEEANMRKPAHDSDGEMVPEEDTPKAEPVTQLLEKNHAPMIIRKYQSFGWPLFIALICDQDLGKLDDIVMEYVKRHNPKHLNNIQDLRNFAGGLSDHVLEFYHDIKFGSVEGVAVVAYWDKCFCSSLYGDFMTHGQCRLELFTSLNMMTNI